MSIVIPCFNYGRFLSEAIESALEQSHAPIEVIVIDDGSTDETLQVAARFEPRITVLTQTNKGLVDVLNRGIREATGPYLTVLSADDRFSPTYVEALLAALAADPSADYAYSAMQYFGAQTGVFEARPFSPALLLAGNYVNGCALIRRDDAIAVGGYDPALEQVTWEDWDFWLRMLAHGKTGVAVEAPLLLYRRHETQSRNPASRAAARRAVAMFRRLHPSLYERRTRPVGELLLFAALVADKIGWRHGLRLLDRLWGFPAEGRSRV